MDVPRPNREPLSVPLILQTAVDLIEREGLDKLSMRGLAAALRVDPMAIYHHVPNKAALLLAVQNRVLGELFEPELPPGPWQERIRTLARRFRALGTRYPQIFAAFVASSETTENELRALDTLLGVLLDAGLDRRAAVQAGDALFAFVTGFAMLEVAHTQHDGEVFGALRPGEAGAEPSPTERLRDELLAHPFSGSFEFGLTALITGIEHGGP